MSESGSEDPSKALSFTERLRRFLRAPDLYPSQQPPNSSGNTLNPNGTYVGFLGERMMPPSAATKPPQEAVAANPTPIQPQETPVK